MKNQAGFVSVKNMHEFRRARNFPRHRTTMTVQSPRVSVHYIIPAGTTLSRRMKWQALLSSMPVILAMIIGAGVGSFLVWESKFGAANREALEPVVESTGNNLPWVKLLEFDQSELDVISEILPALVEENRHEPTAEEIRNEERKEKLRAYFKSRKSPFGEGDDTLQAFLDSKNMKLMIAISFVESTMGKKCYYHNCSGIGGYPPNLRKYDNYAGWVKDFDSLLERRYKGVSIDDFMGLYVQPGSPNWINGVKQILAELKNNSIE